MGNTSSANLNSAASLDSFIAELGDISFEKTLNSSRFLKCVRGRHKDGQVIVKVFIKSGVVNLQNATQQMQVEKDVLMGLANALSYQRIVETDRAAYLIRQYIFSNLYDRLSIRPFLEPVEKRWIVFQLLNGLRDCHTRGIRHGDIKTENILVTSWNWVYLTDFAFFKPSYLPENNPADFSYYFDTSFRRVCYLAPERFHGPSEAKGGRITDAMDIFSLGCVITELFLDGTPLFDLSQLLRYKNGDYDPAHVLERIDDHEMKSLILSMISLDPDKRLSADNYLTKWRRRAFPVYFSTFLHQYITLISDSQRHHSYSPSMAIDDQLDRMFSEFDKISFFLGFDENENIMENDKMDAPFLSIPNYKSPRLKSNTRALGEDGALIFLSIVLCGLRNTTRSSSRTHSCDVILALSARVSDEIKLDRILPYYISLLADEALETRCAALLCLTRLLKSIAILTPVNAFVFPEYILPRLRVFITDPNPIARIAYARCLPDLISVADHFLDMAQALRKEGYLTFASAIQDEELHPDEDNFTELIEIGKRDQREMIHDMILSLLTDTNSNVKRTLLCSLDCICTSLGRQQSADTVLSHLITYMNDRDWQLKLSLFSNILPLATHLGIHAVEEYILPLLIQSLTEDFIVEKVLTGITRLLCNDLVRSEVARLLTGIILQFLMHPNLWLREATTEYLIALGTKMSPTDIHCFILPQLKPLMRVELSTLSEASIIQALRKPLSAIVLEQATKWAVSATKSLFWQAAIRQREFSGNLDILDSLKSNTGLPSIKKHFTQANIASHKSSLPKSSEDEGYLKKLQALGLRAEDEWKLIVLREYIWRVSHLKLELQRAVTGQEVRTETPIIPTTVFFDTISQQESTTNKHSKHDVQALLRDASLNYDKQRSRNAKTFDTSFPTLSPPIRPIERRATPHIALPTSVENATHKSIASQSSSATASVQEDKPLERKMSLLKIPGISTKAMPEVATSPTVAIGEVDHHCEVPLSEQTQKSRPIAMHSYNGFDPNVLRLLDKVFLQNFEEHESLLSPRINLSIPKPLAKPHPATRFQDTLVAFIHEHTAAISHVKVSPDSLFFVTCSDDGSIKLWDTSKLERNVVNRSRTTYRGLIGSKVRALCFFENSHNIAAASDNGALHMIKVDCTASLHGQGAKYGSMHMIDKLQCDAGEFITDLTQCQLEQQSILLCATNRSRLLIISALTTTVLHTLTNNPSHGSITAMCLDKRRNWIMLGTSRGIMDLWDLRFRIKVKTIALPQFGRVHQLTLHPSRGRGRWLCMISGHRNEVTVWDIEKSQCREVYRASDTSPADYSPWNMDEKKPEELLARFSDELNVDGSAAQSNYARSLMAFAGSEQKSAFIASAGTDLKLRIWDVNKPEQSAILSQSDGKPSYTTALEGNTTIISETIRKHKKATLTSSHPHTDIILDLAFIPWPLPMLVSVDRSGVVRVTL